MISLAYDLTTRQACFVVHDAPRWHHDAIRDAWGWRFQAGTFPTYMTRLVYRGQTYNLSHGFAWKDARPL